MQTSGLRHPAWSAIIIAFCMWHMAAILLYNLSVSLPHEIPFVQRMIYPYILYTSQWQKWDVFSPDPMRRVSSFTIERNAGDRWEIAWKMTYEDLPWSLRVKEMKILDRLAGGWKGLIPTYLLSLCPELPMSSGREIRLMMRYFILPSDLPTLRSMRDRRFQEGFEFLGSVRCPKL